MFPPRYKSFPARLKLAAAFAAVSLIATVVLHSRPPADMQDAEHSGSSEEVSEVVANLASGEVLLIAAHDGVVIATIGNQFEIGDSAPEIVPMGERNASVLLGAVQWVQPPRDQTVLSLDSQLPRLINALGSKAPRLSSNTNMQNLDEVGIQILEPLRLAAQRLHAQVNLPDNLPLAEVVLVHQPYLNRPSVVDLSYWIRQTFLQENFWDTEIERPRITQIYPVKDNDSGLIDVRYPPDDHTPSLFDWLGHPTGRLERAIETDGKMVQAQHDIAAGEGEKAHLEGLVPLVKTAIETMTQKEGRAMAVLEGDHGFVWVIQPPPQPSQQLKRPAGAPSLRSTPHP